MSPHPPVVAVSLAQPAGLVRSWLLAWAFVGAVAAMAWALAFWHGSQTLAATALVQAWTLALSATGLAWLGAAAVFAWRASSPSGELIHRQGEWFARIAPATSELPAQVRLIADMQRWLLIHWKAEGAWHWLWLRQPQQDWQHPSARSTWLNLRRALVASTVRP
jgi:hypothetical protein